MRSSFAIVALFLLLQCKPPAKDVSTASLQNTYWKLSTMNGKAIVTPENGREVHIVLSKEGDDLKLKGFAGCNSMGGSYTTTGDNIKFVVISTKMFCQDRMEVENYLFSVLQKADHYKIEGEKLTLYEGTTLLTTFDSVYFN